MGPGVAAEAPIGPDGSPERGFCTDRPTKSNQACILDEGLFQVESAPLDVVLDHGVSTTAAAATTVKYGLSPNEDVEIAVTPLETLRQPQASGGPRTLAGFGDLYLRSKIGVLGQDTGDLAVTLLPYLKIPTARTPLGDGAVEGGLIAPVVWKLNAAFTLTAGPELDVLKNSRDDGRHVAMVQLLNLGWAASPTLTLYGELWNDQAFDPAGTTQQTTADAALAWVFAPNLQADAGINVGLNRQAPPFELYAGLSRRF